MYGVVNKFVAVGYTLESGRSTYYDSLSVIEKWKVKIMRVVGYQRIPPNHLVYSFCAYPFDCVE